MGLLYLTRRSRFSAGARYWLDRLSPEENRHLFGRRAGVHGSGHDYEVDVTICGRVDPVTGMVVNISELKPLLEETLLQPLTGSMLGEAHPLLTGLPPLPEVLACAFWLQLQEAMDRRGLGAALHAVKVRSDRHTAAERSEEKGLPMVTLTRTYEFAAAHRLHAAELGEQENLELFGKCNNPMGHGHNYVLEVTVGGAQNLETGAVIPLPELDAVVHQQVVDRYDHRHLNLDVEEFRELVPTSENVVRVIWDRLQQALPAGLLRRVTLHETGRNSFTYEGETS